MPRVQRPNHDDRPPDLADASRGERLQRVLADAGVASRRDAERLIEEGRVEINGHIVTTMPVFVDPRVDRILVNGRKLPPPERPMYVLLNKPPRTLTASRDEPGADRQTVLDLVDHPAKAQLFPVGRLDYDTVGLLVLTNDGELANRLTHPRFGVTKTYRAVVRGGLTPEDAAELERGIMLTDRKDGQSEGASRTNPVEVRVLRAERERSTIELVLREGRNRQVRRMLAAVDLPVRKLERVAFGPLTLKGVPRGAWRELTKKEVDALRRAASMGERKGGARAGGQSASNPGSGKPKQAAAKRASGRGSA